MKYLPIAVLFTVLCHTLAAPSERIQKKTCKPGTTWKEECHSCYCTDDEKTVCSKEACPPQLVPRSRRNINYQRGCKEGESWKEDCHTCFCSWGRPACTRELCPSESNMTIVLDDVENTEPQQQQLQPTKRETPCVEGSVWKDDCHTCHCTHGTAACTRELCASEATYQIAIPDQTAREKRDLSSAESEEDERCPPNVKEWKEDCNDCYCGDDGLKVCSKNLCPDQGTVVGIIPKE